MRTRSPRPTYSIVTRWEKDDKGNKLEIDGKFALECAAIERKDTGDWAIPGASRIGSLKVPGVSLMLRRFASRESNRPKEASDGFSPTGIFRPVIRGSHGGEYP